MDITTVEELEDVIGTVAETWHERYAENDAEGMSHYTRQMQELREHPLYSELLARWEAG